MSSKVAIINAIRQLLGTVEVDTVDYTKTGEAINGDKKIRPSQVQPKEMQSEFRVSSNGRTHSSDKVEWVFNVLLEFQGHEIDSQALESVLISNTPRIVISNNGIDTTYLILLTRMQFEHPATQGRTRGSIVTLTLSINPIR